MAQEVFKFKVSIQLEDVLKAQVLFLIKELEVFLSYFHIYPSTVAYVELCEKTHYSLHFSIRIPKLVPELWGLLVFMLLSVIFFHLYLACLPLRL